MMFTRKISPDSFDQSLLNNRGESEHSFNQAFDPETGEVFDRSAQAFQEKHNLGNAFNPHPKYNLSQTLPISARLEKHLPTVVLALIFIVGLTLAAHQLINEYQTTSIAHSNQLKLISQGQSQILDAIEELQDQFSHDVLEVLQTNTEQMAASVSATLNNTKVSAQPSKESKETHKKQVAKIKTLKGVKYLGSIKHHDAHQTLLDIDGKVRSLKIGDQLKDGWMLSAIDERKIIATTAEGGKQVIDLTQANQ